MDWTARAWRLLCWMAALTALAAVTGALWSLPPVLLGLALTPGLLVMLLVAIASYANSQSSRGNSRRR